jgi:hypothetical protein
VAAVTISDVLSLDGESEHLLAFQLDEPVPGQASDIYAVQLSGFVVGRSCSQSRLELIAPGLRRWELPIDLERPDVAGSHPGVPWAGQSGFRVAVSGLPLGREFELDLQVVLDDGTCLRLATIRGQRQAIPSGTSQELQPIVLTTLPEVGSSWALWLLGRHPEVVSYRPFEREPRVASYWAAILAAMSEPRSYLQSVSAEPAGDDWWLGGRQSSPDREQDADPGMERWLGREQIEDLVSFCKGRIEAFYRRASIWEGKQPRYFAEACRASSHIRAMLPELYPGGREVFLVRDLRDVACAALASGEPAGGAEESILNSLRERVAELLDAWTIRSDVSYLLKYEDLVLRPGEALASVFAHIGIDPRPSLEARPTDRAAEGAQSIGRWRQELDGSLQAACEEALGDALSAFGYR